MADDGETKDDVKVPDGEIGDKIQKLFTTEEKDTSEYHYIKKSQKSVWLINSIDVIVLTAMGEQLAVEAKEAPRG